MNDSSHFSRLLGLLFAVAVLAVASRWLQPGADAADGPSAGDADALPARNESAFRVAEASVAPVHVPVPAQVPGQDRRAVRLGSPTSADAAALQSARPISAALCHALDERLRALDQQAANGKLPKHEQRRLRGERQRARDLLTGLRCRAGGDSYWF